MKKCLKCQHKEDDNANFCGMCGAPFITNNSGTLSTMHPIDEETNEDLVFKYSFTGDSWFYAIIIFPLSIVLFVCTIIRSHLISVLKEEADLIERKSDFTNVSRISKRKKIGLYDRYNGRIILEPNYDDIVFFDPEHYLLKKNNDKGLYSLTQKKIIIPVKYRFISQTNNYSNVAVDFDNNESIYDFKGNNL